MSESIYDNWPENLPREMLIRYLRVFARQRYEAEHRLAGLFPDRFPPGDGEYVPREERFFLEELPELVTLVEIEMKRLREGSTAHDG